VQEGNRKNRDRDGSPQKNYLYRFFTPSPFLSFLKKGKNSFFKSLRRNFVYLLFTLYRKGIFLLPSPLRILFHRYLGRSAFYLFRKEREEGLKQIQIVFPDLPPSRQKEILLASYEELAISALELLHIQRGKELPPVEIEGFSYLEEAYAQGKGVIVATAHFGNWEVLAMEVSRKGFPVAVLAKPIYDLRLERFMEKVRSRFGIETIPVEEKTTVRKILSALRNGKILGILFDLKTRGDSLTLPLFGKPASIPTTPSRLALRGIPLLFASIRRENGRHKGEFIPIPPSDLAGTTLTLIHHLEKTVLSSPSSWVWIQKRFL